MHTALRPQVRLKALAAIAALLCSGLIGPAATAQTAAPTANPDVRLPSIHSRWATPADVPKPESTIEDLERCVGQDIAMQQQLSRLKARQAELDAQRQPLNAEQEAIQRNSDKIEVERKAVNEQFATFERAQQDMGRRRAEITALTGKPAANATEAKRVQDLVDRFNADLRTMDVKRQAVVARNNGFNQQVKDHNARLQDLQSRITPWEARWQSYTQDVKAANDTVSSHNARCAGERTLVKPSAASDALP